MNRAVQLVARFVFAQVSGRHADNQSRIECASYGLAQRIICIRVDGHRAKTQIQHADVVGSFLADAPVDTGDRIRGRTAAL